MTSPQDPWQQGQPGHHPPHPHQGGYYQPDPNSGGFPQVGGFQPGYPQQPGYPPANPYAAPPVSEREMAGPACPTTVTTAFWIAMVVPVLVTVLYAVYMLLGLQFFNERMTSGLGSGPSTDGMREVATGVATAFVFLFGVVIVLYGVLTALWILFGFKMRAGRNWARVTLTVFAALWGLTSVVALVSGGATFQSGGAELQMPGGLIALNYVQNALSLFAMITFVVLVFLRPSNWYFQATARR